MSTVGGNEAAAGTVENRVGSSRGKAGPPCGPAVPLLGAYPKEVEAGHRGKPVSPRLMQRYSQTPRRKRPSVCQRWMGEKCGVCLFWYMYSPLTHTKRQPGGSDGKESAGSEGDTGSIPELGRSPGERNGSIFAWRIPCTEEPGGLQSMGSQRVRHG